MPLLVCPVCYVSKLTALSSHPPSPLKASRESLTSLRAVADQGRGDMRSQLQRKESDLARAAAAADAAAQQADDLRHAAEKATLVRAAYVQEGEENLGARKAQNLLASGKPLLALPALLATLHLLLPPPPARPANVPPPACACAAMQERERLALQVQQLQAQLAKRGEDARDREARVTALLAQMDEKSAALEAAQVGAGWPEWDGLAVVDIAGRVVFDMRI